MNCLRFEITSDADDFLAECTRADTRLEYYTAFNKFQRPQEKLLDFSTATMDRYAFEMVELGNPQDRADGRKVRPAMWQIYYDLLQTFPNEDKDHESWYAPITPAQKQDLDGRIKGDLDSSFKSIKVPEW